MLLSICTLLMQLSCIANSSTPIDGPPAHTHHPKIQLLLSPHRHPADLANNNWCCLQVLKPSPSIHVQQSFLAPAASTITARPPHDLQTRGAAAPGTASSSITSRRQGRRRIHRLPPPVRDKSSGPFSYRPSSTRRISTANHYPATPHHLCASSPWRPRATHTSSRSRMADTIPKRTCKAHTSQLRTAPPSPHPASRTCLLHSNHHL